LPDIEMSPPMLVGPKRAISGPNEPPRSDRVIADNLRGLYGSALFSSMLRGAAFLIPRNGAIYANISGFAVFFRIRMLVRHRALDPEPADTIEDISDP
jgi:hypothetical protein